MSLALLNSSWFYYSFMCEECYSSWGMVYYSSCGIMYHSSWGIVYRSSWGIIYHYSFARRIEIRGLDGSSMSETEMLTNCHGNSLNNTTSCVRPCRRTVSCPSYHMWWLILHLLWCQIWPLTTVQAYGKLVTDKITILPSMLWARARHGWAIGWATNSRFFKFVLW